MPGESYSMRLRSSLLYVYYVFSGPINSLVLPWYNHTSWLGIKHQFTYLLTPLCVDFTQLVCLIFQ